MESSAMLIKDMSPAANNSSDLIPKNSVRVKGPLSPLVLFSQGHFCVVSFKLRRASWKCHKSYTYGIRPFLHG